MALASEILARSYEGMTSCFADVSDEDVVREFLALDEEIGLLRLLRGINATEQETLAKGNVILMFTDADQLEVESDIP